MTKPLHAGKAAANGVLAARLAAAGVTGPADPLGPGGVLEVLASSVDRAALGLGWAEGPRGSLFYCVHVGNGGTFARVKIKSPSFSNWRVFPFTVHDSNMMDYAINEASFGLTIAGCDR